MNIRNREKNPLNETASLDGDFLKPFVDRANGFRRCDALFPRFSRCDGSSPATLPEYGTKIDKKPKKNQTRTFPALSYGLWLFHENSTDTDRHPE
jgi:hypothetical protein